MTHMPIPHSRPWIGDAEKKAVADVLDSAMLIGGDRRQGFREALCRLSPSITSCSLFPSGRAALAAALRALRLPPGSDVIVQTYVCDAVTWAIRQAGHQPVLCDIGDGWVCEPSTVEAARTKNSAALILAPPFGFAQSAQPFRRFGMPIVHDLCQASPGLLRHRAKQDLGDLVTLSFHATKYVSAMSGGAVFDLAGHFGSALAESEAEFDAFAPLTDAQCAMGLVQIERLADMRTCRERLATRMLALLPQKYGHRLEAVIDVARGDLFRLPLDVGHLSAKDLIQRFSRAGVSARQGVDQLAHRDFLLDDRDFPNALRAFQKTLSLPFHPSLSEQDVQVLEAAAVSILC